MAITLSVTIGMDDFMLAASAKDEKNNPKYGHYSELIAGLFKKRHGVSIIDHSRLKRFPQQNSQNRWEWYIEGELGISLGRE